jgi:hypothetical protein
MSRSSVGRNSGFYFCKITERAKFEKMSQNTDLESMILFFWLASKKTTNQRNDRRT